MANDLTKSAGPSFDYYKNYVGKEASWRGPGPDLYPVPSYPGLTAVSNSFSFHRLRSEKIGFFLINRLLGEVD